MLKLSGKNFSQIRDPDHSSVPTTSLPNWSQQHSHDQHNATGANKPSMCACAAEWRCHLPAALSEPRKGTNFTHFIYLNFNCKKTLYSILAAAQYSVWFDEQTRIGEMRGSLWKQEKQREMFVFLFARTGSNWAISVDRTLFEKVAGKNMPPVRTKPRISACRVRWFGQYQQHVVFPSTLSDYLPPMMITQWL